MTWLFAGAAGTGGIALPAAILLGLPNPCRAAMTTIVVAQPTRGG